LQHNTSTSNLSPENRYGHHITFSGSTHSTSIEHAVPQQLSPQTALNCNDAKVNGIAIRTRAIHGHDHDVVLEHLKPRYVEAFGGFVTRPHPESGVAALLGRGG
jgi:hypothetical protein